MYSQPPSPRVAPRRFENRALLDAVRLISGDLVKRAGISSTDNTYANLLSDIWGQSHYATIEILAAKRRHALAKRPRKQPSKGKTPPPTPPPSAADAQGRLRKPAEDDPRGPDDAGKKRRAQRKNAARDQLVRLLRRVKEDSLVANERRLTCLLAKNEAELDVDSVRRLWGVPQVVFEAAGLDVYFRENRSIKNVTDFYDRHITRTSPDSRIFNVLYWKECREEKGEGGRRRNGKGTFRSISKSIVATVIRLLLTKRRSPFFEKNMDVVVETVLYGINPDRFVDRFRESFLREAGFFQGVQGYEYSRSFTGALENLQLGKLNRMLKDIRAVKVVDDEDTIATGRTDFLSLHAVTKYCAERDTLTDRALRAVQSRYVLRHRSDGRVDDCEVLGMTQADFVRMYLALVGSGTDPGLKYWFAILDQDGDGWVGAGDVAHFYAERKLESENRNGILLADVRCLWIRLCAMSGVSPNGKGLDLNSLKDLGREEREFMMCALLVRRADDGNLTNVAATLSAEVNGGCTL